MSLMLLCCCLGASELIRLISRGRRDGEVRHKVWNIMSSRSYKPWRPSGLCLGDDIPSRPRPGAATSDSLDSLQFFSAPPLMRMWDLGGGTPSGVSTWVCAQIRRFATKTSQEDGNHTACALHLHLLREEHCEEALGGHLELQGLWEDCCWWSLDRFVS
jgi:hypothetical protein